MHYNGKAKLVAVAIDKERAAQSALKWAIENLLGRGQSVLLIHVKVTAHGSCPISSVSPIQMPRLNRISNPSDEHGGNGEVDSGTKDIFLPYRVYCTRKDIICQDIVLEDTDEVKALLEFVSRTGVEVLVLGSTTKSNNIFRFKGRDIPASVVKGVPDFCSVFVISRGKIVSTRTASRPAPAIHPIRQQIMQQANNIPPNPYTSLSETPKNSVGGSVSASGASTPEETLLIKSPFSHRKAPNGKPYEFSSTDSDISFVSSGRQSVDNLFPRDSFESGSTPPGRLSGFSDMENNQSFDFGSSSRHFSLGSGSLTPPESFICTEPSEEVENEMKRLKEQLKQTIDMYSSVCKEAISAKQKAMELHKWKREEQKRLEESRIAEEVAFSVAAVKERAKSKAAIGHADAVQRIAERESKRRISAEMKAIRESKDKNYKSHRLSDIRYRKYTIEEIEAATNYFDHSLKIGEGGYGPVYKCNLDHTPVAVKVLRPDAAQGRSQFHQEVEVLSCIRHPHMVLLLGACPEYGCLVYEYMSNGSLEDRLHRRGNTPPLSWQHRFTISHEIGIALLFLHQTKPEPIVHRDLKPANILLDRNYVSKISDVGLARLVPPSVADTVTQYRMTSTAGTFCYIDPEYQQTGMLGVKSDIYSLGIIFLQLLTGRPPMGLTHYVERAIEIDKFHEILDQSIQNWPIEEALSLAKLALKCAQLRRKDRPDLAKAVMPVLDNLRALAENNMPYPMVPMSAPLHSIVQTSVSRDDLSYPATGQSDSTGSLKSTE